MTTYLEVQKKATASFAACFQSTPTIWARAPGRVNLIGEHTDYNDGFVLPCAINFGTLVGISARHDRLVCVVAADQLDARDEFSLDAPITQSQENPWSNYVRGVVRELQSAGYALNGANLSVSGNVPQGAGLSSSASLEVAVGQAFKALYGLQKLLPSQLAVLAQRAENDFVGCRCGIMDQMISACGKARHALLLDCRSLVATPISMPAELVVLIVNSNVRRGLVESEYNTRRQQCEAAAAYYGVKALRDLKIEQLENPPADLPALVFRRARHVVTENQRTLDAADALTRGDIAELSRLMSASHLSMRDDFEITTPAIDHLVDIVGEVVGKRGGVRMTGGGFGGCVVALTTHALAQEAITQIAERYRSPQGAPATSFLCVPSDGVGTF